MGGMCRMLCKRRRMWSLTVTVDVSQKFLSFVNCSLGIKLTKESEKK